MPLVKCINPHCQNLVEDDEDGSCLTACSPTCKEVWEEEWAEAGDAFHFPFLHSDIIASAPPPIIIKG